MSANNSYVDNSNYRRILPIANPPITSYTNIASTFCILWNKEKQTIPWLCDHMIQLMGREENGHNIDQWANFYDFSPKDGMAAYEGIPFVSKCKFDRSALDITDFASFVETQVNAGYYVHAYLDRYYFKASYSYMKEHYNHQTFIYGYDRAANEICVADFYRQKFDFVTVSYQDINMSYNSSLSVNQEHINFWKNHIYTSKLLEFDYEMNLELLELSLKDYIERKDSFLKYKYTFTHRNVITYVGLDFYKVLKIHCNKNNEYIDYRAFHVLCDHKTAMRIRFAHLRDIGLINSAALSQLGSDIDSLVEKTLKLRNMVIKHSFQNSDTLRKRIIDELEILEYLDYKVSSKMLNALFA